MYEDNPKNGRGGAGKLCIAIVPGAVAIVPGAAIVRLDCIPSRPLGLPSGRQEAQKCRNSLEWPVDVESNSGDLDQSGRQEVMSGSGALVQGRPFGNACDRFKGAPCALVCIV